MENQEERLGAAMLAAKLLLFGTYAFAFVLLFVLFDFYMDRTGDLDGARLGLFIICFFGGLVWGLVSTGLLCWLHAKLFLITRKLKYGLPWPKIGLAFFVVTHLCIVSLIANAFIPSLAVSFLHPLFLTSCIFCLVFFAENIRRKLEVA